MLELFAKFRPHRFPGYNDLGKDDSAPAPVYVAPSEGMTASDYQAAAAATGQANIEAARQATKANRVNQYTPYGNLTYTDLGNDRWRSDMSLSPSQQSLLDQQTSTSLGLGNTMNRALGYTQDALNSPFDKSDLPTIGVTPDVAGREAVTAALLERQQPTFDRNRQQKENSLLVTGHNPGGEAWKAAQDDLSRAENDARLAAIGAGGAEQSRLFGLGSSARQNALQEKSFLRNEPLNTLNAVRTGAQVTMPTFQNVPQQSTTQGANYLGAQSAFGSNQMQNAGNAYSSQLAAYNASQANNNNMMSGLFGLGSAALGLF